MSNKLFTCPSCCGHKFGTDLSDVPSLHGLSIEQMSRVIDDHGVGYCSTLDCNFRWPRKDDHLYMKNEYGCFNCAHTFPSSDECTCCTTTPFEDPSNWRSRLFHVRLVSSDGVDVVDDIVSRLPSG